MIKQKNKQSRKSHVSIIIPVYNEEEIMEKNIRKLMKFLGKNRLAYEIVITSNGSTDRTNEIGKQLAEKYKQVKFFTLPEKNVGGAFVNNVRHARYDNIISMDMDLSVDMDFIIKSLQLLGKNDIVVGSKKVGEQQRSAIREFISNTYIFMVRKLLGLDFTDYSMAAKAFHRKAIMPYLPKLNKTTFYVIEIIYFIKKAGGNIKEIPVLCRDFRKSKFNLFKEIYQRFRDLILFWIKNKKP